MPSAGSAGQGSPGWEGLGLGPLLRCVPSVCPSEGRGLAAERVAGPEAPANPVLAGQEPTQTHPDPQHLQLRGVSGSFRGVMGGGGPAPAPALGWPAGQPPLLTFMTKSSRVIYFPLILPVSAPCPIRAVEHTGGKTEHVSHRCSCAEKPALPPPGAGGLQRPETLLEPQLRGRGGGLEAGEPLQRE